MPNERKLFSDMTPPLGYLLEIGLPDGRIVYGCLIHPYRRDGWVVPCLVDESCNVLSILKREAESPDDPVWWRYAKDQDWFEIEGRHDA